MSQSLSSLPATNDRRQPSWRRCARTACFPFFESAHAMSASLSSATYGVVVDRGARARARRTLTRPKRSGNGTGSFGPTTGSERPVGPALGFFAAVGMASSSEELDSPGT